MILNWILKIWGFINKIHPETRSLLLILMFGYILYSLITDATRQQIAEKFKEEVLHNKKAEQYSMNTSSEVCHLVLLISERDLDAFNVLLLNYHNNTQSLQGYKYLYLSCLVEAPRSLDAPLLKQLWNKIDYIYYADELSKIHNQGFICIENIEIMKSKLPKLYRLVKNSEALSVSFYTIEGKDSAIGMVVILYKEPRSFKISQYKNISSCILKLAILLDYENVEK